MRNQKDILKKKVEYLEKSRDALLSKNIKEYEYWKEKIYKELFLKKRNTEVRF